MAVSPFRFERPLDPGDLIGRAGELARLVELALDRRLISLAAPRRYGKTSLLQAVGEELSRHHDFLVVHVDLLGLAGPEDFASRLGAEWQRATAGSKKLRRQWHALLSQLSALGLSVLGTGVTVSRREPDSAAGLALVHALLELPADAGQPVLVVLDEFQALHAAWPDGEGVLRSHVQSRRHREAAAWVFAGSQPSLLADAFALAGRAFYRQALAVPLGRLADADVARGIDVRFRATGKDAGAMLDPLVRLADGHPQRAMMLAHELWQATDRVADPAAFGVALGAVRRAVQDETEAVWASLSAVQQAALRAVHQTGTPLAGAGSTTRSSRQRARDALLRASLIEPLSETAGERRYRPVDPLLGDWLDQRGR